VSFATIILHVPSQRVFVVVSVYLVIDSVRKLLDVPSYYLCPILRDEFQNLVQFLKEMPG
jgi:hypothetical protein